MTPTQAKQLVWATQISRLSNLSRSSRLRRSARLAGVREYFGARGMIFQLKSNRDWNGVGRGVGRSHSAAKAGEEA
jgi:hypothetical protein